MQGMQQCIPCFPAIEYAIPAANIGTIIPKAAPPPISLKAFAITLKLGSLGSLSLIPNIKLKAIKIPPEITNGNIKFTPDIKCL